MKKVSSTTYSSNSKENQSFNCDSKLKERRRSSTKRKLEKKFEASSHASVTQVEPSFNYEGMAPLNSIKESINSINLDAVSPHFY